MCVHCRTQFFIKEFSAAIRTLPVRHHGHLKKLSSNFLVFFVVLVVIELSEKIMHMSNLDMKVELIWFLRGKQAYMSCPIGVNNTNSLTSGTFATPQ